MTAAQVLLALLALLPVPAARRACITARRDAIVANATRSADAAHVPVEVLLVVAYLESHVGCAPGSGGCWGAPISPTRRGTAGNSNHAAAALAWGYRRCHTDLGAIAHFRYGRCATPARHGPGYTPEAAMRLVERVRAYAPPATP